MKQFREKAYYMNQMIHQLIKSDVPIMMVILGLAFYVSFIPHINYPYPVHVDEWVHISFANELITERSFTIVEPFTGDPLQIENRLEFGFQLPLGIFQEVTGISWNFIFRYFPSLIFMITIFLVYLFARKEGFGWQAALLSCLVPTTVGILGPAFLVPVSVGLVFLPLIFFLSFNSRKWWSYLLIFIFTGFLISMHGPSIVCIIIVLLPYIIMNIRKETRHSLKLASALLIPFLLVLPFSLDMVIPLFKSVFSDQASGIPIRIPNLFDVFGVLPIILAVIGLLSLSIRGGIKKPVSPRGYCFF